MDGDHLGGQHGLEFVSRLDGVQDGQDSVEDLFFDRVRVAVEYTGNPDFVKLAEAYGIWGVRVMEKAQVRKAIQDAIEVEGPALIDFRVEPEENVYPHVPAGGSVADMIEGPAKRAEPTWPR